MCKKGGASLRRVEIALEKDIPHVWCVALEYFLDHLFITVMALVEKYVGNVVERDRLKRSIMPWIRTYILLINF